MKMIGVVCFVLFTACAEEKVVTITEYVPIRITLDPLIVSFTGTVWNEHVANSNDIWVIYSSGMVTNENDVDCVVVPGLEITRDGDSLFTSFGVIGHGRYPDINAGLVDTINYIPAHETAEFFIQKVMFANGRDAVGRNIFEVGQVLTIWEADGNSN